MKNLSKENFTFTVDEEKNKDCRNKESRLAKTNAEIMKVILDNGEEINALNHLFMLKDGTYRSPELKIRRFFNAFLFQISTKKTIKVVGYEMIFNQILKNELFSCSCR